MIDWKCAQHWRFSFAENPYLWVERIRLCRTRDQISAADRVANQNDWPNTCCLANNFHLANMNSYSFVHSLLGHLLLFTQCPKHSLATGRSTVENLLVAHCIFNFFVSKQVLPTTETDAHGATSPTRGIIYRSSLGRTIKFRGEMRIINLRYKNTYSDPTSAAHRDLAAHLKTHVRYFCIDKIRGIGLKKEVWERRWHTK